MFQLSRILLIRRRTWAKVGIYSTAYALLIAGIRPVLDLSDGPGLLFGAYELLTMGTVGVGFFWCADSISRDFGKRPRVEWPGWRRTARRTLPLLAAVFFLYAIFMTVLFGRSIWSAGLTGGLAGGALGGGGCGAVLSVGIYFLRKRWNS